MLGNHDEKKLNSKDTSCLLSLKRSIFADIVPGFYLVYLKFDWFPL